MVVITQRISTASRAWRAVSNVEISCRSRLEFDTFHARKLALMSMGASWGRFAEP
jgi:hypothetical protein